MLASAFGVKVASCPEGCLGRSHFMKCLPHSRQVFGAGCQAAILSGQTKREEREAGFAQLLPFCGVSSHASRSRLLGDKSEELGGVTKS